MRSKRLKIIWDHTHLQSQKKFLGLLRNLTNCTCFTTEVWKKRWFKKKRVTRYCSPGSDWLTDWLKFQVVVFNIVWGWEVRQVKLYSRLACAQKRQSANLSQGICSWLWVSADKRVLTHSDSYLSCLNFTRKFSRSTSVTYVSLHFLAISQLVKISTYFSANDCIFVWNLGYQ